MEGIEGQPAHLGESQGYRIMGYQKEILERDCLVGYYFSNDRLKGAKLSFLEQHTNKNQNIADSDADLAADLRREVHEQLAAGATEEEILAFMTERYGDFVLYRPPLDAATLALWGGPFALVLVGGALLVLRLRRDRASAGAGRADAGLDEQARQRIAALTGDQQEPR